MFLWAVSPCHCDSILIGGCTAIVAQGDEFVSSKTCVRHFREYKTTVGNLERVAFLCVDLFFLEKKRERKAAVRSVAKISRRKKGRMKRPDRIRLFRVSALTLACDTIPPTASSSRLSATMVGRVEAAESISDARRSLSAVSFDSDLRSGFAGSQQAHQDPTDKTDSVTTIELVQQHTASS